MDDLTATQERRDEAAKTAATAHPETYKGATPLKVNKLGHLVYEVSDMERTVRFWTDVMGFEETDRNEIGMVFFRCGADHHAIGLKPGKAGSRPETGSALRMEHLALEVSNMDELFRMRDFLKENGIPLVFEGRKGAGGNAGLHFCDPDGYEFEIYCGMDQIGTSGVLRPEEQFHRVKSLEDAVANPLPKTW